MRMARMMRVGKQGSVGGLARLLAMLMRMQAGFEPLVLCVFKQVHAFMQGT